MTIKTFKRLMVILIVVLLIGTMISCNINKGKISSTYPTATASVTETFDFTSTPTITETLLEEPVKTTEENLISEEWKNFFKKRPFFELGVNKDLKDKIKVHLFFINDNESSWDEETISAYMNKQITPGLKYLESQASRFGISLNLSTVKYKTDSHLKYNGVISKRTETADIMNRIAVQLGYENQEKLQQDLANENPYGEVILMAVVNKDGISYTSSQATGSPGGISNIEYCVVFTSYLNKNFGIDQNTHMAATVAHEILHLYGAEDIYEDTYKETAKQLCPDDIMLLDYLNIEQMKVSKYTAYSMGWSKTSPY